MGTWDVGSFASDAAMDFVAEIVENGSSVIARAFAEVASAAGRYLDADYAARALAAAETVAALAGNASPDLPEEISDWVARSTTPPSSTLLADARTAVDRVARESELDELWADSPDYDVWRAVVADLRARLG